MHEDIQLLLEQLAAATAEATTLTAGLSEEEAGMRLSPTSWSITQCIEHLALTNNLYLEAMQKAAVSGRKRGKLRRRPARPGFLGGWFAAKIEPSINSGFRMKTIASLQPQAGSSLASAFTAFTSSQHAVEELIRSSADLDLSSIRYSNPIVRGMNFSLASGLYIILAHERRHLWQARMVRNAVNPASP